jgi:UDP-N-acetylmuramate--alanine ligase
MQDPSHLAAQINDLATSGDLVMCLGAGTVTQWASSLPQELALLRSASPDKEAGE